MLLLKFFLRIGRTLFYHHYHHISPQKYDAKSPNGITIPFSQLLYGTWAWTSIWREKFFSLFQHHFMEVNYRKGNWTTIFAVARKGDKKVQQAIMYQNHSTSRSVVRQNIDLTSKHELFKDHCESLIISIEDHCYLLVFTHKNEQLILRNVCHCFNWQIEDSPMTKRVGNSIAG